MEIRRVLGTETKLLAVHGVNLEEQLQCWAGGEGRRERTMMECASDSEMECFAHKVCTSTSDLNMLSALLIILDNMSLTAEEAGMAARMQSITEPRGAGWPTG